MTQALPTEVLREIAAHASATYPSECCGFVVADRDGALRFLPIPNLAGTPQERETSKRDARDGYVMDPTAVFRVLSTWGEDALRVIVHSHPDVGAYFSNEDRTKALFEGKPLWPGVDYLVVSCRNGKVDDARLYSWDGPRADFLEEEVPITSAFR